MKNLMTINFYGDRVYLAEVNGEPYVPVKPICENLGIDWKSQYAKLVANRKRWNCGDITIVAQDGKLREMLCIPLRKLPAWLYSISPEKVKPEVREKLLLYQEECDRVLWDYWMKGVAVNPRKAEPALTLEDVRRVVREEMDGVRREIELARKMAFAEGVKAGIEIVRRYERCALRKRPAHFLSEVLALSGVLSDAQIARLTGRSRWAVSRARKMFAEIGVEPEALQLPLFQKTQAPTLN